MTNDDSQSSHTQELENLPVPPSAPKPDPLPVIPEGVSSLLSNGDLRGLHPHLLKGERAGQLAVDIPGLGKDRGGGRVIYQEAGGGSVEI